MLQDSILFPAVLWRDSMKDSSCEKTVVRADIKTNRLKEIIFKLKWSFLSFVYAWKMGDEIVIAHMYSTDWAILISSRCSWTMLELEGHVDLTIRKQLSKQTWQGRCQEEGVPARVAECNHSNWMHGGAIPRAGRRSQVKKKLYFFIQEIRLCDGLHREVAVHFNEMTDYCQKLNQFASSTALKWSSLPL